MKIPLDVHFYVTPRCNLSCPHCYYDALERGRPPANLMALPVISEVLTGLCDRFEADISLEGGEPFLRAGLGNMLATLKAEVLSSITITTNGTVKLAAPQEVLRQLGGIRVSIDGHLDELQQVLRGVDLAPVLRSCAKLRQWQVPHTVRMTLWKRNIGSLAAIYDWAAENEITRLSLFEYQSSGRGIGQDLMYGVSTPEVRRFITDFIELPRPETLELVTVNLAERRVEDVISRRKAFSDAGIVVKELPETANCTVNFDGTVGVSPWLVTAHGAPDVFTRVTEPDFLDIVEKAAGAGALQDRNECLSRVQLRCQR